MRTKHNKKTEKLIVKTCLFCKKTFYAKRDCAKFCCDSHKVQYNSWIKTTYFVRDPNEGKALSPGTITNLQIPENKMIFQGDKDSLYRKLLELVPEKQLFQEKEFIEKLIPFSTVKNWSKSSTQVFRDKNFLEVLRISLKDYKLYEDTWEEDNEKIL